MRQISDIFARKFCGIHTLAKPSRAIVVRTTSIAPLYMPLSAVCRRTLTRSKGWPTITAHTPPTPPATKDRMLDTVAAVAWTTSSLSSSVVVGIDGVEEPVEVESDMVEGGLVGSLGEINGRTKLAKGFVAIEVMNIQCIELFRGYSEF